MHCHVGVLGGHRNPEKTIACIRRLCWWKGMSGDVWRWVKSCGTCLRFRSVPQKVPTSPSLPVSIECWQEVTVDMEGPSNPADRHGNKYMMTYVCCLCHAVYLEPCKNLTGAEVRRAMGRCICRSGTLPSMIRSDRGVEFKNALMQEYVALLGVSA